jgi:hypothetical protein
MRCGSRRLGKSLPQALLAAACLGLLFGCAEEPVELAAAPDLEAYVLTSLPDEIEHRAFADLGGKVHLVGYSLGGATVARPGSEIQLTCYWRSVQKLSPGWQLFTHVVDASGRRIVHADNAGPLRRLVAREDGRRLQALPPSDWQPGYFYVDKQTFRLPNELDTEEVTITVGVWRQDAIRSARTREEDAARRPLRLDLRLDVLSGPSDGTNRVILAHLPTGFVRPKTAAVEAPSED